MSTALFTCKGNQLVEKVGEMMPMLPNQIRFRPSFDEVPMSMLNEQRCKDNHGQTLKRIKERGGFSISEFLDNILDLPMKVIVSEAEVPGKLIELTKLLSDHLCKFKVFTIADRSNPYWVEDKDYPEGEFVVKTTQVGGRSVKDLMGIPIDYERHFQYLAYPPEEVSNEGELWGRIWHLATTRDKKTFTEWATKNHSINLKR